MVLVLNVNTTDLFLGRHFRTYNSKKIKAKPDSFFDSVIISSKDFECNREHDCTIISEQKKMEYKGKTLFYKEAET